jgi:hypothetical protein
MPLLLADNEACSKQSWQILFMSPPPSKKSRATIQDLNWTRNVCILTTIKRQSRRLSTKQPISGLLIQCFDQDLLRLLGSACHNHLSFANRGFQLLALPTNIRLAWTSQHQWHWKNLKHWYPVLCWAHRTSDPDRWCRLVDLCSTSALTYKGSCCRHGSFARSRSVSSPEWHRLKIYFYLVSWHWRHWDVLY